MWKMISACFFGGWGGGGLNSIKKYSCLENVDECSIRTENKRLYFIRIKGNWKVQG